MQNFITILNQSWPWYVAGPILALVMFLMLYTGKTFGVSSTLRTICAASGAGRKVSFFDFDWKSEVWNILFVIGVIIGGIIASTWMSSPKEAMELASSTIENLDHLGMQSPENNLLPMELFDGKNISNPRILLYLIIGGFLVGFGARYAGGCTSGHAITGLSNLQLPSLIAVVGFFIGGLIMTFLVLPYLVPYIIK